MPEVLSLRPFSVAYVSGDLGQALVLRDGVALMFDGSRVSEASTGEINMFFDLSMEFHEIEPGAEGLPDEAGLADYLRRETIAADAVRLLLFGMDRELSDGLRLSSITRAATLLDSPDIRDHVRRHFLRLAPPDDWDSTAAAMLAALAGADLPCLLYLAVDDPAALEELTSLDPADWPVAAAASRLVKRVAGNRDDLARQPVWNLAADWLGHASAAFRPAEWFIGRFGQVNEPPVAALVARALIVQAAEHYRLGDTAVAEAMLDRAAIRAAAAADDRFPPIAAMAMVSRAWILARHDRVAEAQQLNAAAIALVAGRRDPLSRTWTAEAMFATARNHGTLGQRQQAIDQYDALIATFTGERAPRVRVLVAKAMYNRANALLATGDLPAAQEAYRAIERMLQPDGMRDLDIVLAMARYNLACVSNRLREYQSAMTGFDVVAKTCADHVGDERAGLWQDALYNLGTIVAQAGDHRAAIRYYERTLAALAGMQNDDRLLLAAQASFNLALSYEATRDLSRAITTYTTIESLFASVAGAAGIVHKAGARVLNIRFGRDPDSDLIAPALPDEGAPEDASPSADLARMFGLDDD